MKIAAIVDPPYKLSRLEISSRTKRLEEAGVNSLWTGTMLLAESFTLAGYIAALATKPRIAVGVVNPYTRHPLTIAQGAATLDRFCGHRTILVLGFGWPLWIRDQLRVEADPIRDMDVFVKALRALLRGEAVSVEAKGFRLVEGRVYGPKPEKIPIYIAAKRNRALKLTSRIADGVLLGPYLTARHVRWTRDFLSQFETTRPDFEICAQLEIRITDNPISAREELKPDLAYFLAEPGIEYYLEKSGFDTGFLQEIRQALQPEYPLHPVGQKKLSKAAELVPDEYVDECCIIGSREDCVERLAEYKVAGLTSVVLSFQDAFDSNIPHLSSIIQSVGC